MKILIIEDNPRLSDRIIHHLGKFFEFDSYETAEDGLLAATQNQYGVIILDLGLPDMTGLEACQQIRRQNLSTPILILTGRSEVDSKVELLMAGADDYMIKPFDIGELRARIRALSRRNSKQGRIRKTINCGELILDPEKREVLRAGNKIALRRKEFDILECLLMNVGQIMSREAIMSYAWSATSSSWTSTVDVHIKHLRDKIDRPFSTPYIKTVYGIGYRIENVPEKSINK